MTGASKTACLTAAACTAGAPVAVTRAGRRAHLPLHLTSHLALHLARAYLERMHLARGPVAMRTTGLEPAISALGGLRLAIRPRAQQRHEFHRVFFK